MLMPPRPGVVELPARSLAGVTAVAVWPAPSEDSVTGAGQPATPDPADPSARWGSVQEKLTVTGARYQPLPLGDRSGVAITVGGVSSSWMLLEDDPRLPAASAADSAMVWWPSVEIVSVAVQVPPPPAAPLLASRPQLATPEPAEPSARAGSEQDSVSWTGVLYQPLAGGDGLVARERVG